MVRTAVATRLTMMKGTGGTYPLLKPRSSSPAGAATAQHLAAVAAAGPIRPSAAALP